MKTLAKKNATKKDATPSDIIAAKIASLPDWRGEMLASLRAIIRAADPESSKR